MKTCERCGAPPPRIEGGEWEGQPGMLDYCESCSKDLCGECMVAGTCSESPDKKHKAAEEE